MGGILKKVDNSLTIDGETVSCCGEFVRGEGTDNLVEALVGGVSVRDVLDG